MSECLKELLNEVEELICVGEWKSEHYNDFIKKKIPNTPTIWFKLSKFENGAWRFNVVGDWHKLMNARLEVNFYGETPEEALENAIDYIKRNLKEYRKCTKI